MSNSSPLGPLIPGYANFSAVQSQSAKLNLTKGTVTQLTSIVTPVVINAVAGVITTQNLAVAPTSSFTVNNDSVNSDSIIMLSLMGYAGTEVPVLSVSAIVGNVASHTAPVQGSFLVTVSNADGSNFDAVSVTIGFALL